MGCILYVYQLYLVRNLHGQGRTLQTLFDIELITFSRLGGKILYPLCVIDRILVENIEVFGRRRGV